MAFSGASVYACFLDVSTYRDLHVDVALVYEGLMFGSVAVAAFMQSRIALSRSQKGCSCIVDSTRKSLPPFPTAAAAVEGARGGEGLTDQPFPSVRWRVHRSANVHCAWSWWCARREH